jgi:DNA polymerase III delta prime subunit
MAHLLVIGGPPRAGKTTVARCLARRHGLRLYSSDTRTWAHRDRALAAGIPAALRWEAMSPEARWSGPAGDLLTLSLEAERGAMVMEDLAGLPPAPLVVAEGSVMPAWAVGTETLARAVWLLPTARCLEARTRHDADGPRRLTRLLAARAAAEAAQHSIPTVTVDLATSVNEVLAQVTAMFADALSAGPRATERPTRASLLRQINLDVVAQVRGYFARPWADGDADVVRASFVCECGSTDCVNEVETAIAVAAEGPILAPGHLRPD